MQQPDTTSDRTLWAALTEDDAVAGMAMIASGARLTIGWWHRALRHPTPTKPAWVDRSQWQPHDLLVAANQIADPHSRLTTEDKEELLAELAANHGLDAVALRDAYLELRRTPHQEAA